MARYTERVSEDQAKTGDLRLPSAILLLSAVVLGSFGQICMKLGLEGATAAGASQLGIVLSVLTWLLRPWVVAGLGLYAASTMLWLLVISQVRLSVAYPMISISYVLVTILSASLLHERVAWLLAIPGLTCICLGVTLIAWRAPGDAGPR